jgi:Ca2+-binding EF-hand superfamily protein
VFTISLVVCFHIYDLNGDGFIQKDELAKLLRTICNVNRKNEKLTKVKISPVHETHMGMIPQVEEEKWVQDFVKATFNEYDTNKDEKLSFEEFKVAAQKNTEVAAIFTLSGLVNT